MAIDPQKYTSVLVNLPNELKEEIEDYQFENRISNRTAAILELLRIGLDNSNKEKPAE